ncbi:phosphoribosylformylglycinamidine cyclo-ligase [Propionicimonas sp.]|uniref:phosphoribosylformylglycinamidine cyclo-ligase n=1 Tax=Propionicimonas sp. TaxID=1955623 RepID=UPI001812A212|nr:phosphoribosylformylglycinamidine cyclo-ligase [Propionicimonas sp.]MBU3976550.1 phosphoribosylformylglycinamidine cyclo-ligase [Actinomycetota bacterium]MBA3020450.1 phosphoribosylformylglycinamidine cyclo-ligase [Propionicimonas sp.]MBU3986623.1 phosphoribosylformylglycinamidine cyclo-ligase [Actinomycetota bacterium]MBU4007225.1 phosphoribosylformylglycinamidine cyclo-ligase [Actinomycetota bacterium]MBU4064978.1 phosphoribosylformylglycinamidine cyclo-ligase [Actinomycetota bacterium]
MAEQSAYAAAGVDIEAGDRAVELMKDAVARSHRPEVLGGLGGFAGFFDASALAKYRHPVLATSTDGVGTKVAIAGAMGVYDTIGWDLIGMLVDDLVVTGAEPLFVTDYIACGKVYPERIAAIVGGVAAACTAAGAALLGGETAEHPGLLGSEEFDMAGATTGVVEFDEILGPDRVVGGDVALALASSGLHSNGYSLVRQVFASAGWELTREVPEFGRALGEELLTPTRVYARDLLAVIRAVEVHAISHITGGGLANNLVRVLPAGVQVEIDRGTWTPPAVFDLVQRLGAVSQPDIEATLNQGVGMVMMLPESSVAAAQQSLSAAGIESWVAGSATAVPGPVAQVDLRGAHPSR